jgi:Domain of unknown function (DUF4124)
MRKKPSFIVPLIVVVGVGVASAQEIYRWVDAEGRVHYGDQRPPDSQAERVQVDTNEPSNAAASGAELMRLLERNEAAVEKRAQDRRERDATAETRNTAQGAELQSCREARRNLVVLEWQWPVYRDEQEQVRLQWAGDTYAGAREYLDDETRAAEITRTKAEIRAKCADPDSTEEQELARELLILTEVCAAERADLYRLEQPEQRTPESDLSRKRDEVREYCGH